MFDVGDLPVLTFGNWVLKAEWLSGLWNYMYVFLTFFFKIQKTWLFTFFELLHTFSPTVDTTYTHLEYIFQCVGVSSDSMDRTYRCRRNSRRRASGTSRHPWAPRSAADSRHFADSGPGDSSTSRKSAGDDVCDGCHGNVMLLCQCSTHLHNQTHARTVSTAIFHVNLRWAVVPRLAIFLFILLQCASS